MKILAQYIKIIIIYSFITTITQATYPYKDNSTYQPVSDLEGYDLPRGLTMPRPREFEEEATIPKASPSKAPLSYPFTDCESDSGPLKLVSYPPLYATRPFLSRGLSTMRERLRAPSYGHKSDLPPTQTFCSVHPDQSSMSYGTRPVPRLPFMIQSPFPNPYLSQGFPLQPISHSLPWAHHPGTIASPDPLPPFAFTRPVPGRLQPQSQNLEVLEPQPSTQGSKRPRPPEKAFLFYEGTSGTFSYPSSKSQGNKRSKAEQENQENLSFKESHALKNRREEQNGEGIAIDEQAYKNFKDNFGHLYTLQQEEAIADIKANLVAGQLMDRLVCEEINSEDETEVAFHAAWLIAQAGKQVAIIMPNRTLAQHYYRTFKKRFKETDLNILYLPSYNEKGYKSSDREKVNQVLEVGKNNIFVGTTANLYKDTINNLGLFIIHEKHTLSVKQKERLRLQYHNTHMLWMAGRAISQTLTLTPAINEAHVKNINRLRAALLNRKIIDCEWIVAPKILYDKIQSELLRNGNIFFIVPRICQNKDGNNLQSYANFLQRRFAPESVLIAHDKKNDDEVLNCFRNEFKKILVLTGITDMVIKMVIDMPHAKTIIIAEPEHFGNPELYHLRERIGGNNIQVKLYLFDPQRSQDKENELRLNAS